MASGESEQRRDMLRLLHSQVENAEQLPVALLPRDMDLLGSNFGLSGTQARALLDRLVAEGYLDGVHQLDWVHIRRLTDKGLRFIGVLPAEPGVAQHQTIVYSLQGANPRVNVNSVDASVNVISTSPGNLFEQMREAIAGGIADPERRAALLGEVEAMESAQGTPTFLDRYKEFVALAGEHVQLLAPFIPALTQMLS